MCVCVTVVLGFAAHSIISGTVCSSDDDGLDDDDRYDYLGYGTDYEESAEEYSD